ncbi:MAG TPA: ABC transporter ATP-binding protein [Candidatus Sulfomarinibacteraceae bacterium]|nr:ABC transporter ATP-binding protein [Candidatus Sulfomarinibacteraceae bacterium]
MSTLRQYGRLLAHYLRPQWKAAALLTVLIVGAISLQLINPQLVRRFLDAAERGRSLQELLLTAGMFMGLALLAQVLKVAGTYVGENVAWRATNELRADLALHCLKLDMDFHKRHKPGELIERVDGDVNQLANFFSQLVIELGSNLLLLSGVLILLWLVDWRVGATITLIAVAAMFVLNWFNRRIVPRWQTVRQVESDLFGYLEEWLSGTEEIQTNRAGSYIMGRLFQLMRRRWRSMQSAQRMSLYVMSLPTIIPTLAYVGAYLWGDSLHRGGVLTIGTVYIIFYYIDVIRGPLWGIQRQVQDLQRAAASMNRIINLLAEQPVLPAAGERILPEGALAVQFDGVCFYYADDPESAVLNDITFELAPGSVLGLLGRTGSGKTTLTRLLLRFYDPTAGVVRLGRGNGQMWDLRDLSEEALRDGIGMVTQEVQLFHATVRDNLTLFDDGVDDERIHGALRELGLTPWLAALPHGLNTRLEAGASLSAGEAQLLALARVFLADAGLVILDEASSRLDPATEQLLERALDRLLQGRTSIIIAHRLSTIRRADEIIILADGRILEKGALAELATDHNSHFYHLLQVGMEEALA